MKKLFQKYYNSVLSPDEFLRLKDFIGNKKNDSIIYALMQALWDKQLNDTDVSPRENPALYKRIQEAVFLEKQKAAQRRINLYTWGLRVAVVLVVSLLISNVFLFRKPAGNQFADTVQTITTPFGAKTKVNLPDGSSVWLNSGSTLSYPTKFGKSRSVTLLGEAYFDVEKGKKPFVVSTDYGKVEVKGTAFNVRAFSEDNCFETTLEEGSVMFITKNALSNVILKPGEQVFKTATGFAVKKVETKYFTSWKEGRLLFYKEPFPSFIKKLERWYNIEIEYTDPKLDELWYTGTIEMESVSEVMEMISKAAPISCHFNNKTRVFTIKAK